MGNADLEETYESNDLILADSPELKYYFRVLYLP